LFLSQQMQLHRSRVVGLVPVWSPCATSVSRRSGLVRFYVTAGRRTCSYTWDCRPCIACRTWSGRTRHVTTPHRDTVPCRACWRHCISPCTSLVFPSVCPVSQWSASQPSVESSDTRRWDRQQQTAAV